MTQPHPPRCVGCHGTGWKPGPDKLQVVNGHTHRYTTVQPCDHDWWHDDTGYDPYYDDPIERDHPRAIAAFNEGVIRGRAELAQLRGDQPPARKGAA